MRCGSWLSLPKPAAVALIVAALLAEPAAAEWLQDGASPDRTGFVDVSAPADFDVALNLTVPAWQGRDNPILVAGGDLFLASSPPRAVDEYPPGIWSINTTTTNVTRTVVVEGGPVSGLASDGKRLYFVAESAVQAYDIAARRIAWRQSMEEWVDPLEGKGLVCPPMAVEAGHVFLMCASWAPPEGAEPGSSAGVSNGDAFVARLHGSTGEIEWASRVEATRINDGYRARPVALSVTDDVVIAHLYAGAGFGELVPSCDDTQADPGNDFYLVAYEPSNGDMAWANTVPRTRVDTSTRADDLADAVVRAAPGLRDPLFWFDYGGSIAGSEPTMFAFHGGLYRISPDDGCLELVSQAPPGPAADAVLPAVPNQWFVSEEVYGSVPGDDRLLVTPSATILAYHAGYASLKPRDVAWTSPPAVGDRSIHAPGAATATYAAWPLEYGGLLVHRLSDGQVLFAKEPDGWSADAKGDGRVAVAEGLLVHGDGRDNVTVYGTLPGSIQVGVEGSPGSASPGEPVTLNLSTTRNGIQGGALQFRISWGDGAVTDWTNDVELSHSYRQAMEFDVVVEARNDAGQTRTHRVKLDVGGAALIGSEAARPGVGDATQRTGAGPVSGAMGGDTWLAWILAGAALLLVTSVAALAVTLRIRGASDPKSEAIYRGVLHGSMKGHRSMPRDDATWRALRSELGITDRQHSALLAETRAKAIGRNVPDWRAGSLFLDRYLLRRPLGAGGQAAVFLARDKVLGRDVVIKMLHRADQSPGALRREASQMARVSDAHVVAIYDIERVGERVYVVMEPMSGGSLASRLEKGPVDRAQFDVLALDMLLGLEAIHKRNIVHGDIKPANVLLDGEGRAKIADFGVARHNAADVTVTMSSPMTGTIRYMSPEQARGHAPTRASDLFAVGLVLYEAWTGRAYFDCRRESAFELRTRIAVQGPFNRPFQGPEALRNWFRRMLAARAGNRFGTAGEARRALETALGIGGERPARPQRRRG